MPTCGHVLLDNGGRRRVKWTFQSLNQIYNSNCPSLFDWNSNNKYGSFFAQQIHYRVLTSPCVSLCSEDFLHPINQFVCIMNFNAHEKLQKHFTSNSNFIPEDEPNAIFYSSWWSWVLYFNTLTWGPLWIHLINN